jgi:hypothetical protein
VDVKELPAQRPAHAPTQPENSPLFQYPGSGQSRLPPGQYLPFIYLGVKQQQGVKKVGDTKE